MVLFFIQLAEAIDFEPKNVVVIKITSNASLKREKIDWWKMSPR
jgi:hypothetical protein